MAFLGNISHETIGRAKFCQQLGSEDEQCNLENYSNLSNLDIFKFSPKLTENLSALINSWRLKQKFNIRWASGLSHGLKYYIDKAFEISKANSSQLLVCKVAAFVRINPSYRKCFGYCFFDCRPISCKHVSSLTVGAMGDSNAKCS